MPLYTFIGDIHSAADDLAVLLADPEVTATRLIFLGDYIDGTAARYFGHATESAPLAPLKVLTMVRKRVREYGDVALLGLAIMMNFGYGQLMVMTMPPQLGC